MEVIIYTDDSQRTVELPSKREVCDTCNGDGTVLNPAISPYGDGSFTASEWGEACDGDPDFAHDYMHTKIYHINCPDCKGNKVVDRIDHTRCQDDSRYREDYKLWRIQEDEHNDFLLIQAAERRAGC